ncbi:MAG TPA: hypothetical protein VEX86_07705 [Longimicrobium sp.]|nr:hypothetical protein [Longimicrobium sp.]
MVPDELRMKLSAAREEALRVGDSPLRADLLADKLAPLAREVHASPATDETKARITAALADAERVLRRDDDGREAARHLTTALSHTEVRTRKASPFLDDD